eukprot:Nk52_evm77s207 gene=Nk52_evmTU77s207
MIDRDPRYFAPILNFLRHGKLIIDNHISEEGVLEEAEFYNVEDIITEVKQRICIKNETQSQLPRKKVFRVFECTDSELTQMVSTLSDGWCIEQLVSLSDPRKFVLVLSKDVPDKEMFSTVCGPQSPRRAQRIQKSIQKFEWNF